MWSPASLSFCYPYSQCRVAEAEAAAPREQMAEAAVTPPEGMAGEAAPVPPGRVAGAAAEAQEMAAEADAHLEATAEAQGTDRGWQ